MNRGKGASLTGRFMLVIGSLLLVTNLLLGWVLMHQTTSIIEKMVQKNMLDVSNTAAGLLDGDALGALTQADVGGKAYRDVYDKLSVFQNNIDIEYIYAIRQVGEDRFIFTVDPDPVEPGAFGEEVVVTPAMVQAGQGVATVDNIAVRDRWGNFYSAFSPVFDSQGQVAGIVGVDFNSQWYDQQIRQNTLSIGCLTTLFVLAGVAVMFIITRKVRQRLMYVSHELTVLSSELDELTQQYTPAQADPAPAPEARREGLDATGDGQVSDDLEELGGKIQRMQKEIQLYLGYLHEQAYTDALTQVGNTSAYLEAQEKLAQAIGSDSADFGVAVFDINLLKLTNDRCGHACGDRVIQEAAKAISGVFGQSNTYRIGGDEFLALLSPATEALMQSRLDAVERQVEQCNEGREGLVGRLSLSMGYAVYRPGSDTGFQDVFVRADGMMYQRKEVFHQRVKDLPELYFRRGQ